MTSARRLLPNQVHMITRRCSERRFFLKPTKKTDQILRYCLGVALERYSVELYALVVEANHLHGVVGDPKGELSKFMKLFDELVARAFNAHYGRGESFWSPGSYSNTEIWDRDTLIAKLVYVLVNPVKDNLVERPEHWPGILSAPEDMGVLTETVQRPDFGFFGGRRPSDWIAEGALSAVDAVQARAARAVRRAEQAPRRDRSSLPDRVTITYSLPDVGDRDTFVAEVRSALEAEISLAHDRRQGRPVLGAAKIRQLNPFHSAGETWPKFRLNPRIACGDTELRMSLIAGLQAWREAYAFALAAWRSGRRRVYFPAGTFWMYELHNCRVEGEAA